MREVKPHEPIYIKVKGSRKNWVMQQAKERGISCNCVIKKLIDAVRGNGEEFDR